MNAPPLYADPGYSTPFDPVLPSNRQPSSVDPGVPPVLYYFIGDLETMASNHVEKWPWHYQCNLICHGPPQKIICIGTV